MRKGRKLGERMQELWKRGIARFGTHGQIQPFFLRRVFGIRLHAPRSPDAFKQKIRELVAVPISWLSRVTGQFAYVEMQLCRDCFFIQTKIPFHDDDIMHLYADYRSPA